MRTNGSCVRSALRVVAICATLFAGVRPCLADATLALEFSGPSGPFSPGELVQVKVRMSGVPAATPAAGFQAFVRFDSSRLSFVSGAYTSTPFGLHIITPVAPVGENIDLAAGINTFVGQQPSSADADLALLTFQVTTTCGVGAVEFRTNRPPTRLTESDGTEILPLELIDLDADPTCPPDVAPSGAVDVDDLIAVILGWGPCPPQPQCCPGNTNNDAAVDVDDLIAVILGWGPCP